MKMVKKTTVKTKKAPKMMMYGGKVTKTKKMMMNGGKTSKSKSMKKMY